MGLSTFTQMDENEFIALLSDSPALQATFRTQLEYTVLHLSQIEEVDRKAARLLQRLDPGGLEK